MGKRKSGFAGLIFYWSRRSESNGQPAVYDTAALPIELRQHELERATGFEPAILGLGSRCSTTEPRPLRNLYFMISRTESQAQLMPSLPLFVKGNEDPVNIFYKKKGVVF
jgi:hypothetical protein